MQFHAGGTIVAKDAVEVDQRDPPNYLIGRVALINNSIFRNNRSTCVSAMCKSTCRGLAIAFTTKPSTMATAQWDSWKRPMMRRWHDPTRERTLNLMQQLQSKFLQQQQLTCQVEPILLCQCKKQYLKAELPAHLHFLLLKFEHASSQGSPQIPEARNWICWHAPWSQRVSTSANSNSNRCLIFPFKSLLSFLKGSLWQVKLNPSRIFELSQWPHCHLQSGMRPSMSSCDFHKLSWKCGCFGQLLWCPHPQLNKYIQKMTWVNMK